MIEFEHKDALVLHRLMQTKTNTEIPISVEHREDVQDIRFYPIEAYEVDPAKEAVVQSFIDGLNTLTVTPSAPSIVEGETFTIAYPNANGDTGVLVMVLRDGVVYSPMTLYAITGSETVSFQTEEGDSGLYSFVICRPSPNNNENAIVGLKVTK